MSPVRVLLVTAVGASLCTHLMKVSEIFKKEKKKEIC